MATIRRQSLETPGNPENFVFFPDYRGFPFPANENGHQIWILHVKIHKFNEKIPIFKMTLK